MTFNAFITVAVNRLTDVSQGSVMTIIRRSGLFCHCFVANHSGIHVPKIIIIEHDLIKLLRK